MARPRLPINDPAVLNAALEGLTLQKQRLEEQIRQVQALIGRKQTPKAAVPAAAPAAAPKKGRRALSAAARARIAAAQKRRWANYRKQTRKGGRKAAEAPATE